MDSLTYYSLQLYQSPLTSKAADPSLKRVETQGQRRSGHRSASARIALS